MEALQSPSAYPLPGIIMFCRAQRDRWRAYDIGGSLYNITKDPPWYSGTTPCLPLSVPSINSLAYEVLLLTMQLATCLQLLNVLLQDGGWCNATLPAAANYTVHEQTYGLCCCQRRPCRLSNRPVRIQQVPRLDEVLRRTPEEHRSIWNHQLSTRLQNGILKKTSTPQGSPTRSAQAKIFRFEPTQTFGF